MNDNFKFVLKATGLHLLTYVVCGIIFSVLFDYHSLFTMEGVKDFMKEVGGTSTHIGPWVNVLRGILFGLALLLFKDSFIGQKFGWLKLWGILSIIGIINTPGPAPFSIEGVVYTKLPLKFHLLGAPEILIQTLMFSYLVAKPSNNKKIKFIEENKNEFISAIVCMVLFSLSGIILALIRGISIESSVSDIGAFFVMFIAVVVTFFIAKFYLRMNSKIRDVVTIAVLYVVMAVLPYFYNLITDSPFATSLTLLINFVSAIILWFMIRRQFIQTEEKGSH